MTIQEMGAVGELIGGIAVVVTLIYLALQIRQNTHTQRRANYGDIASNLAATLQTAAPSPEMGELIIRGHADIDSLEPAERYRFDIFLYCWLAPFERAFLDARDGEYPEELLIPMRTAIAGFLRTEGGRVWWEQRKVWFSSFGQTTIEEILSDTALDQRGAGPRPVA